MRDQTFLDGRVEVSKTIPESATRRDNLSGISHTWPRCRNRSVVSAKLPFECHMKATAVVRSGKRMLHGESTRRPLRGRLEPPILSPGFPIFRQREKKVVRRRQSCRVVSEDSRTRSVPVVEAKTFSEPSYLVEIRKNFFQIFQLTIHERINAQRRLSVELALDLPFVPHSSFSKQIMNLCPYTLLPFQLPEGGDRLVMLALFRGRDAEKVWGRHDENDRVQLTQDTRSRGQQRVWGKFLFRRPGSPLKRIYGILINGFAIPTTAFGSRPYRLHSDIIPET